MKISIGLSVMLLLLFSCSNQVSTTTINDTDKLLVETKDTVRNIDSKENDEMVIQTLALAKASVSGDIAEIEAYVNIIIDSSSTKQIKYRAFRVLHDRYPNAFTNIKDVKKAAQKVEDALIRQAQIKLLKEKIAEVNAVKASKNK